MYPYPTRSSGEYRHNIGILPLTRNKMEQKFAKGVDEKIDKETRTALKPLRINLDTIFDLQAPSRNKVIPLVFALMHQ